MKRKLFLLILIFSVFLNGVTAQNINFSENNIDTNIINIEKSPYGLIFTTINVNGKSVKAMIDFGDPHVMQLSGTFVEKNKLNVKKTGFIAKDVFGNSFEMNKGIANKVKIGQWKMNALEFHSSPGDIESVSKEINTEFNAVVGWGFFKPYYTLVDYKNNSFQLFKKKPDFSNATFEAPYHKTSNYLSVPVIINKKNVNLIIDTGAPNLTLDTVFYKENIIKDFVFSLGGQDISHNVVHQDLSILKQLNAVGIIGGDFLKNYKMYINPFKSVLIFQRNE